MVAKHTHLIERAPDPVLAALRLDQLLEHAAVSDFMQNNPQEAETFVHIISLSNFLFRYLCRCPESIELIGAHNARVSDLDRVTEIATLRYLKYRELLRITSLDIKNQVAYEQILTALSVLAEKILRKLLALVTNDSEELCLFAMGKLGGRELNYSSDVDLIFVCANHEDVTVGDINAYHQKTTRWIRNFTRHLEAVETEGFLYRADLRLRPWGKTASLIMSIDDTEHYYELGTEIWERFAWLRARYVAGSESLGTDLLERLRSYRYRYNLDLNDLQEFIDLKNEMALARQQADSWNVKLGVGGIRDIEFFIQVIQMVNARRHPELQQTNITKLIACMIKAGLLNEQHAKAICESYLFLRRLENRLQMIDEAQVHTLPNDSKERLVIARSLGFSDADHDDDTLARFDRYLAKQRDIARECFEMILSKQQHYELD